MGYPQCEWVRPVESQLHRTSKRVQNAKREQEAKNASQPGQTWMRSTRRLCGPSLSLCLLEKITLPQVSLCRNGNRGFSGFVCSRRKSAQKDLHRVLLTCFFCSSALLGNKLLDDRSSANSKQPLPYLSTSPLIVIHRRHRACRMLLSSRPAPFCLSMTSELSASNNHLNSTQDY